MIQANELKIGIWVNYFDKPTFIHNKTELFMAFEHLEAGFISPILLTPEILDKCGFDLTQWFCEGSYKIREDRSDMLYGWTFVVRNANHDREIEFGYFKYVHELQNLYFALTGEELNYNL